MKKYFIAGLLVWLPLAVTIWVLQAVLGLLDGVFGWLLSGSQFVLAGGQPRRHREAAQHTRPRRRRHADRLVPHRPVRGQHGRPVVAEGNWNRILNKIPIVKSIYSSVQQVSEHAVLEQRQRVPAGRAGAVPARRRCGRFAFVTGRPGGETARHLPGDFLSIYVPTTPNPTSGFFLMLRRGDVIPLAMSVDDAFEVRDLDGRGGAGSGQGPGAGAGARAGRLTRLSGACGRPGRGVRSRAPCSAATRTIHAATRTME